MTPDTNARYFDLNIEKILEGWEVCHALREIIANGLDEQILSKSKDIEIAQKTKDVISGILDADSSTST
jgi:hypothetical protein